MSDNKHATKTARLTGLPQPPKRPLSRLARELTRQDRRRKPDNGTRTEARQRRRMTRLALVPTALAEANALVAQHHRPVQGHKFSIGAGKDAQLIGVVIVGRPVSRMRQDGLTLEVTRLCTDGTRNA